MRVAFLGTRGPLTRLPLERVASEHEVVAFVRAAPRRGLRAALHRAAVRAGVRAEDELTTWARAQGIETLWSRGRDDARVRERLARLEVDLLCIATYRWILPPAWLALPRLGAVNVHASLLPRHRGANPFFWLYHANDAQAGASVHRVDERVDAGPILAQEAFDLPRGRSADWTAQRCAERGAQALAEVLARTEVRGCALEGEPQDERLATRAPRVRADTRAVDFERWGTERVWHFLAGLYPRFREPLADERGAPIRYAGVLGFERGDPGGAPGSARRVGDAWHLACADGFVRLAAELAR